MRRGVVALFAMLAVSVFVYSPSIMALISGDSYWIASRYENDLVSVSSADNKPCTNATITLSRPFLTRQACLVHAAWGDIAEDGSIRFVGDTMFQKLALGQNSTVLPVANTDRMYIRTPVDQSGQFKVGYFSADVVENLRQSLLFGGESGAPEPTIIGYNQSVYYEELRQTVTKHEDLVWKSVGFSPNGEWMAGVIQRAEGSGYCVGASAERWCDYATYTNIYTRVRLVDGALGGFGAADGKQVNGLTLSISNDGEAVAVTGWQYWKLDLFTFGFGAALETRSFNTQGEELHTFDDKGVGGQYVSNAFFSSDNKYLYYNVRHAARTDLMRLWPNGGDQVATVDNYLALGDSFSSGEGEYTYRPETNFYKSAIDYNLCHQSTLSYGHLINAVAIPNTFGSVACSGAKVQDVYYQGMSGRDYWKDQPQARGFIYKGNEDKVISNFLPGYIDQNTLVNHVKPSVATISIGGNDVGFADIVKACVINKVIKPYVTKTGEIIPRTCYDTRDQRERLANSVDAQIASLSKTFQAVRANMSGDQRLYVVGYPQAISPAFTVRCDVGTPVAWDEREFLVNFTDYLNEAVRIAAVNAGAVFVDNSNAFIDGDKDYRLCGNQGESAMNDVERNTKSARKPDDKVSKESFHPTLLGHILMTRQIRHQTNDLTRPMNDPLTQENWAHAVDDGYRIRLVGDAQKKGKTTTPLQDITPSTLYKKGAQNTVSIVQYDAAGNARAVLYSEPIELGPLQVGPDGSISGNIVIPPDVPTGYHQLHIVYATATGEEKDIYQYVFVGESPDDLNGDGIADAGQSCIFESQAGIDLSGSGTMGDCVLAATDLQTNDVTAGNNVETLAAVGAISPAEVAMVRSAAQRQDRKPVVANALRADPITADLPQNPAPLLQNETPPESKTDSNAQNPSITQLSKQKRSAWTPAGIAAGLVAGGVTLWAILRFITRRTT